MRKLKNIFLSFIFLPQFFLIGMNQELNESPVFLTYDQPVVQTFRATRDKLYEIQIYANKKNLNFLSPLLFTLKDEKRNTVRKVDFDAKNIGANYWLKLSFLPIPDSRNKVYRMELEAPGLDVKEIEVGYTSKKRLSDAESFLGEKKLDGDFAFRLLYKANLKELITNTIIKTFERFWLDKHFLIFYSGILLTILIAGAKIKQSNNRG